jgi:cyclopropane fatty-acyl-phospholipid synthase-like methyltransferase
MSEANNSSSITEQSTTIDMSNMAEWWNQFDMIVSPVYQSMSNNNNSNKDIENSNNNHTSHSAVFRTLQQTFLTDCPAPLHADSLSLYQTLSDITREWNTTLTQYLALDTFFSPAQR